MFSRLCPLTLAGMAGLISWAGQAQAGPPDLTFLCEKMPQVCTNMCWATRCAAPLFPAQLTFDFPDADKEKQRREKAGCAAGNKCNRGKSGAGHRGAGYESCDEYPFASTAEADRDHKVSRCVPGVQNSYQGGKIQGLARKWKKEGKTRFLIGFGNPGAAGVEYCNNQACGNDGWEVQDGKIAACDKEAEEGEQRLFRYYRTRAGMVLASLEPIDMLANFTREVHEADAVEDETWQVWTEVDEAGEERFIQDSIVEELPWNHFLDRHV